MKGTVLLPTLNRPKELKKFFKSYWETQSTVPGMILVHAGDPSLKEYQDVTIPDNWELIITGDMISMADKVHSVWDKIVDMDYVMILNDDHRPRTKLWDQKILSKITGTNIIATNDGPAPDQPWTAPHRLAGAICYSGKVLKTIGWMWPPGLKHFFHDDIWARLGQRAGNVEIIMDVCVEHEHAYKDPSKVDETFELINGKNAHEAIKKTGQGSGGYWPGDRAAYQRWIQEDAEKDAQKIIALQPKQGLMIGFLAHDQSVSVDFAMGLMDTALALGQNNIYFEVARIESSSLVPHARNAVVDMFLKSKCQRLLFIDSDQGFNKNHVFNLFTSNRPIIAGVTPHKRFPINLNFEPLEEDRKFFSNLNNKSAEEFFKFAKEKGNDCGEIEVNRAGTGFIMIDRSVFDTLSSKVEGYVPFDNAIDGEHKEFFRMGKHKDRFRGEDWYFCEAAKDAGIPIHVSAHALVVHQGNFKYAIDERLRHMHAVVEPAHMDENPQETIAP